MGGGPPEEIPPEGIELFQKISKRIKFVYKPELFKNPHVDVNNKKTKIENSINVIINFFSLCLSPCLHHILSYSIKIWKHLFLKKKYLNMLI